VDTTVRKRSVTIAGHQTSVSLEEAFWDALKRAAAARGVSLNALVEAVDGEREGNLSSAIRVFVLGEAMAGRLDGRAADAANLDGEGRLGPSWDGSPGESSDPSA
jgi:predicted DNA-binding ribbon-helix-helix protein